MQYVNTVLMIAGAPTTAFAVASFLRMRRRSVGRAAAFTPPTVVTSNGHVLLKSRVLMRTTALGCCLLAVVVTACGGGGAAAQADAKKTAAALTGKDQVAPLNNPQCELFAPAELAKFVGVPLSPGANAAMGTGCQWVASSGDGSVMIQVVPARYHEPHRGAEGFKKLPDVGSQGFVEEALDGWNAGAITGAQAVVVSVGGPAANEATAIALLKETIARRSK